MSTRLPQRRALARSVAAGRVGPAGQKGFTEQFGSVYRMSPSVLPGEAASTAFMNAFVNPTWSAGTPSASRPGSVVPPTRRFEFQKRLNVTRELGMEKLRK